MNVSNPGDPQTHPVMRVAHLTTVDLSLRFLLWPQLVAAVEGGAETYGISSPGPWVIEVEAAGVHHITLQSSTRGVSLLSDVRASLEFWRAIRRTPVTVLHTHNPKPGIYGRILGRIAGIPVVVNTLHGFYATDTDPLLKRLVVYGLEALAARFSDAELHQNVEDLELATRLRIAPRSRVRLLGNGIDLTRFDPTTVDPGARVRIRAELGAGENQHVVGTVGRLVAEKGLPELFEAAERLGEGFVIVVVGPVDPDKPDALPSSLIDRAEAAGVRFLGMREDMEDLYSAMDIFVLPSHREGFPRAAMEAAAMGLPVVATDIRGCRQVVVDGVNGLLVPVRDPGAIAVALKALADDPDLRDAMSTESRRIALKEFDERRVVSIVMDTYRQVLTAKGLAHLIPPAMLGTETEHVRVRAAGVDDVRSIANLHFDFIREGFLRRLGRRFIRALYRGILDAPETRVLVAEDAGGIVGFVAGVEDLVGFRRWFLRRRWARAALASLPAVFRRGNLRQVRESIAYGRGGQSGAVSGEVLSLVVAPRVRGRGLGLELLERLLDVLGANRVKVVVARENLTAIDLYEKAGFERVGLVEVHHGEPSLEMVKVR